MFLSFERHLASWSGFAIPGHIPVRVGLEHTLASIQQHESVFPRIRDHDAASDLDVDKKPDPLPGP